MGTKRAPETLLFPERERGPVRAILVRIFIALACVVLTATVVYVERDGYRDVDGQVDSWLDAFYYATVTLSTTGYGDITPVSESARWTNIFLITPLRFIFLIVLVGTTIEVLTERSRQQFRFSRWRRRVKEHTVVVGYGTKGRSAVSALMDQGCAAESIVVVDNTAANVKAATADGCVGVFGDARREEVLRQAAVRHAKRIIVAAREEQNIGTLKQGGADVVIPTAESAGRLLGLSTIAPNAGELIEDLLEPVAGLQIQERDIRPEDVGLSPARLTAQGEIVLTVIRNGTAHRFDSGGVKVFQPGDRIVVIRAKDTPHQSRRDSIDNSVGGTDTTRAGTDEPVATHWR